jgi:hypothetical protein
MSKIEVIEAKEPAPNPAPPMASEDNVLWNPWSLLRIKVIIDDRPITIPASRGARKVIFDFMSETISASKSLRR